MKREKSALEKSIVMERNSLEYANTTLQTENIII